MLWIPGVRSFALHIRSLDNPGHFIYSNTVFDMPRQFPHPYVQHHLSRTFAYDLVIIIGNRIPVFTESFRYQSAVVDGPPTLERTTSSTHRGLTPARTVRNEFRYS